MGAGNIIIDFIEQNSIIKLGRDLTSIYLTKVESGKLKTLDENLMNSIGSDNFKEALKIYYGHAVWESTYYLAAINEDIYKSQPKVLTHITKYRITTFNTFSSSAENALLLSEINWSGQKRAQYIKINPIIEISNKTEPKIIQLTDKAPYQELLNKYKTSHEQNIIKKLQPYHNTQINYIIQKSKILTKKIVIFR